MPGLRTAGRPPAVLPETTVVKKRARYWKWVETPSQIKSDLAEYSTKVAEAREKLYGVKEDRAELDATYHLVNDNFMTLLDLLSRERLESQILLKAMHAVCIKEAMTHTGQVRRRKQQSEMASMKDIAAAFKSLGDRQRQLLDANGRCTGVAGSPA